MGMGGMGMGGMGGMGMNIGGHGMDGAVPVPRAAWPEDIAGEPAADTPDPFSIIDDNFRAQLITLRLAAARHRRALQETYFTAAKTGAGVGVRGLDPRAADR